VIAGLFILSFTIELCSKIPKYYNIVVMRYSFKESFVEKKPHISDIDMHYVNATCGKKNQLRV